MARISFTKNTNTTNKHIVQDVIYEWVSKKMNGSNSFLLLSGKHPVECINRVIPLMNRWASIYIYEKDYDLYSFVKNNYIEKINSELNGFRKVRLIHGDIKDASMSIIFQDLDFCATFFSKRNRASINLKYSIDPINIIQERLYFQNRTYTPSTSWKTMIVSISPRNGLGKKHSIECINSLCHQLGWNISRIDHLIRPHYQGYSTGYRIPGSGTIHNNGGKYYAYEHSVTLEKFPISLDQAQDLELRFFTYTDTQPMITFALLYR